MRDLDPITEAIIRNAIRLHRELGPGLLELVYDRLLGRALEQEGLVVVRQASIPFEYLGEKFEHGLRPDLIVEGVVLVELKSIERLATVHSMQLLTYLRLTNLPLGLLINFGGRTLKGGLRRVVNNLPREASAGLTINRARVHGPDGEEALQREVSASLPGLRASA